MNLNKIIAEPYKKNEKFSNNQKEQTYEKIFSAINKLDFDSLEKKSNLDHINTAIEYNKRRLKHNTEKSTNRTRLNKRIEELQNINDFFHKNTGKTFLGLIGWGNGCIQTTLTANDQISSTDGFLYKDTTEQIHYQRLGSCLEYYTLQPLPTNTNISSQKKNNIITDNGIDIHFFDNSISTTNNVEDEHNLLRKYSVKIQKNIQEKFFSSTSEPHQGSLGCINNCCSQPLNLFVITKKNNQGEEESKTNMEPYIKPYLFNTIKHSNHTHIALQSTEYSEEITSQHIRKDQEGCPCCTAGLDFDEFAVAVKLLANSNTSHDKLMHWANVTDATHWGIFLGVSLPFSLIGLTAGYRNIVGSWHNKKTISNFINTINTELENSMGNIRLSEDEKLRKTTSLNAFKKTLEYSHFDSTFNEWVPGYLNGAASTMVMASGIWHQPLALPLIGAYSLGQVGRNFYDLNRSWNRKLPTETQNPLPNVAPAPMQRSAGIKKINQIGRSKRRFYATNAFNFGIFTAGAFITFCSIPALALGVGAVGLPIGLSMLGYGAASTGIANNIWPNKFKPRNGDLGTNRLHLDEDLCIHEIGQRTKMKKILKSVSYNHISHTPTYKKFVKFIAPAGRKITYIASCCVGFCKPLSNLFKHISIQKFNRKPMKHLFNAIGNSFNHIKKTLSKCVSILTKGLAPIKDCSYWAYKKLSTIHRTCINCITNNHIYKITSKTLSFTLYKLHQYSTKQVWKIVPLEWRGLIFQALSAFPFMAETSQKWIHEVNKHLFEKSKESLKKIRTKTLKSLLDIKNQSLNLKDTIESSWEACETLSISHDIINLLIQENPIEQSDQTPINSSANHTSQKCIDGCNHSPDQENYIQTLRALDMFDVKIENKKLYIELKKTLNENRKQKLSEAIDYYLYFDFKEKLRYEERGLDEFFWALKDQTH